MKILITGACAVSARSVLRSLKLSPLFSDSEFIGWDMCNLLYGVYSGEFDRMYRVPAVNEPAYPSVAASILEQERPDGVIVVPEVEVLYWSEHPFRVPHIVPPPRFCDVVISKERLFAALECTGLVPRSMTALAADIASSTFVNPLGFPVWIRDGAAGTASAKGALMARNNDDLRAWVTINAGIPRFQLSEYLPGANYGCFCLFKDGKLVKMAQAERMEYIMAKVALSGITGNTSKGRLLNRQTIKDVALKAISTICLQTDEVMNGLVVVDMKCDSSGRPFVTEINIRHVAYSSSFATAGFNISEYQLLLALGRDAEVSRAVEEQYPLHNLILRDVDGLPVYIRDVKTLAYGECITREEAHALSSPSLQ